MTELYSDLPKEKLRFFGLGKLRPFLKNYKLLFFGMIACTFASGLLQTALPLFQKYAVDFFISERTTADMVPFVLLYVGCILLTAAADYGAYYCCCALEMYILRDMRRAAFNHLQTLSVSYFNVKGVGRIHSRVMSDTGAISSILSWDVHSSVWNVTYALSAVVVMFVLNPILALLVVAIIPVVALVSTYFVRKLTRINRRVREINSVITGGFNEGITGAETSKTLCIEDKLDKDFYAHTEDMRRQSVRQGHHRALFVTIIAFASQVALAVVLWYGGIITSANVLALLGTLTVFMTYAQGLMQPVQWSVDAISDLISVKVNVERFTALMETESDVKDAPEVIEKYGDSFHPKRENWEPLHGDVEFEDVTFKYPDGEEYVLEHFSLKVPQGTNVAIVGETGAGKSTLVNLVCRFFEPTQGRVLIDGKDMRERSVGWLHSNIGYVLQTPHLFSGTVRENLCYGKEDATTEEIERAIESVNAGKVVERLGGLDAPVGEGGNTLSTGEKQLLSFARAILANPAIFVLDEATSSIDTLAEQHIQAAISKLMEGRTSFVIAHRLSTVRAADVILVVDGGKIIERGTHEELLRLHGTYYNLYIRQFREELERKLS